MCCHGLLEVVCCVLSCCMIRSDYILRASWFLIARDSLEETTLPMTQFCLLILPCLEKLWPSCMPFAFCCLWSNSNINSQSAGGLCSMLIRVLLLRYALTTFLLLSFDGKITSLISLHQSCVFANRSKTWHHLYSPTSFDRKHFKLFEHRYRTTLSY